MRQRIELTVNGAAHTLEVEPRDLLLDVLRDRLDLKGAKEGCGTGDCGACTVLIDGEARLGCLTLAVWADGCAVTTIEGLARDDELHPIQEAFIERGAVQCGFCSPGMILATKALLDAVPQPDEHTIRFALAGNLCRCTGYAAIVEAVREAASKLTSRAAGGEQQRQAQ